MKDSAKINKEQLREIMKMAWQFFKQTGINFSDCLRKAWRNIKLRIKLQFGIVRFYFKKVDGTLREAWGTLQNLDDKIKNDKRAKNPTIQVYFDTEKHEFRCFKKFNLETISS